MRIEPAPVLMMGGCIDETNKIKKEQHQMNMQIILGAAGFAFGFSFGMAVLFVWHLFKFHDKEV